MIAHKSLGGDCIGVGRARGSTSLPAETRLTVYRRRQSEDQGRAPISINPQSLRRDVREQVPLRRPSAGGRPQGSASFPAETRLTVYRRRQFKYKFN